ncbi:MAG: hypothetical protein ACYTAF_17065 [Planctomycetota bacterium]|jgi:YHS domain-containing protein
MGDPVSHVHEGREIRFCCKACIKKFKTEPATYLKKMNAAIVKKQLDHYPLKTCVVTGQSLGGDMGKPVNHLHRNRLVRFCCAGCLKGFKKKPDAYLRKIDEAVVKKQLADYPLQTCVVSGKKLGSMGEPLDHVFLTRLVRFCCKACIDTFNKDLHKYLKKIDDAARKKREQDAECGGECGAKHGEPKCACCGGRAEDRKDEPCRGNEGGKDGHGDHNKGKR